MSHNRDFDEMTNFEMLRVWVGGHKHYESDCDPSECHRYNCM